MTELDLSYHCIIKIDSLDRDPVPLHFRPVKHVPGLPVVNAKGDTIITLSPDNAKRYEPYISALRAVDAKRFADVYRHYYPLFQRAYENLGYPGRYFNDRLIPIIDHLLATPDISEPIQLVQPKVLYQREQAHGFELIAQVHLVREARTWRTQSPNSPIIHRFRPDTAHV